MIRAGVPPADIAIDTALVRSLLRAQAPQYADMPLVPVDAGWDNAMFRLGDAFAVRLPRRQLGAGLIEHEQKFLPVLAPHLPLAVPTPVFAGIPGEGYPWRWSIVPWFEGHAVDREPLLPGEADRLARFLRALHQPAADKAPHNPYRGVPLADRAGSVAERLDHLSQKTTLITPRLRAAWEAALAAPPNPARTWLHGDFHARNVIARGGAIAAIIDWGDLCAGDCATDLACIWALFDTRQAREKVRQIYGEASLGQWARAQGWAIFFGAVLVDTGLVDSPRHAAMGEAILRRLDADL